MAENPKTTFTGNISELDCDDFVTFISGKALSLDLALQQAAKHQPDLDKILFNASLPEERIYTSPSNLKNYASWTESI